MKKVFFFVLAPLLLFADLMLYYSPYCPHSREVLDYLDQIHKTVPMKNVYENKTYKEELRKEGGKMQVPCLIIDGKPLYHSADIIQWLSQHQDRLQDSSPGHSIKSK